jgi:plastocyanin
MRARRFFVVLVAVVLVMAGCSSDNKDDTAGGGPASSAQSSSTTQALDDTPSPDTVDLAAGQNDPENLRISVNEFLPEKIEVKAGAEVTWQLDTTEVHSVTFLPDGEQPPSQADQAALDALFVPSTDGDAVDGQTLVNSGLQPLADDYPGFTATFPKAGDYTYYCVIHPRMIGTVTVTDGESESQADISERAESELSDYLAEGRAAGNELADAPVKQEPNDKGGTTYTVETGVTTEHTDVLAFAPTDIKNLTTDDEITFVNNSESAHTATFGPKGDYPSIDDGIVAFDQAAQEVVPGASPQVLKADTYFNTGFLLPAGLPDPLRSYTFSFDEPGSYSYVCLLHAESDMVGTIEVQAG